MLDLSFPCLIAASRQMWHFQTLPKQQPCSFQLQTHVHFLTHALRSFFPSMPLIFFQRTVLFREPRAPLADQRLMKLSGEPVSAQPAFYQAPIRCECRRCVSRPLQVGITQRPSAPLPVCPSSNSSHQLPTTGLREAFPTHSNTPRHAFTGTHQTVICCSGPVAQVTHSCSALGEEVEVEMDTYNTLDLLISLLLASMLNMEHFGEFSAFF